MDKKYAGNKFYQNKLKNLMEKLKITKYYAKYTETEAFLNFKYNNKWYNIKHTLKNAQKTDSSIKYGSDLYAQLILTLEDLIRIKDRNICDFSNWISQFEIKAGDVSLPDCFKKLGFDGSYMPTKKNIDYKYNELAKILNPANAFGDKDKFEELNRLKEECYDFIKRQGE